MKNRLGSLEIKGNSDNPEDEEKQDKDNIDNEGQIKENSHLLEDTIIQNPPEIEPEEKPKRQMKVSVALVEDEPEEAKDVDVLIAKKSAFETELFVKIVSSLGHTYETASSKDELEELVKRNRYKVIVFDGEYPQLDIDSFVNIARQNNKDAKLIMLNKPDAQVDEAKANLVNEVVKEKVNKELVKTLFEKYI